jgi:parvulin-like peptidyl-prolyl isomerase
MAKSRRPQAPTKKHLARLERERVQQRYLLIGLIVVLVGIVAVLGYGGLQKLVLEPRAAVAQVGDTTITVSQFQERVRYQRSQLVNTYINTYQTMQLFAGQNAEFELSFRNQMQQIRFQLDPSSLGREVLNSMVDDILIRKEAEKRGITVTEAEIDKAIQDQFGYFPDGAPPTPTAFPTALPTATLSPEQLALATPHPPATSAPTATPDPSATPTTLPSPTPVLTPTATATPYTQEAFTKDYQEIITQLKDNLEFSEAGLRDLIRSQLYREKMVDVLAVDVSLTAPQVWARHILVADEAAAREVLEKLNSGEDWSALASQYSTDESNKDLGGDLGWFGTGRMVVEFEQAAFNLNVGQVSEPIPTQFGWHIIQVLGKEERSISQSEYEQARLDRLENWLVGQRSDPSIQIFDLWSGVVPTTPDIPAELLQGA